MAKPHITGRHLRHGSPEENLSPGESILVKKPRGKLFELKRIDSGEKNVLAGLDRLLSEMPPTGRRAAVNLSAIIIADRE